MKTTPYKFMVRLPPDMRDQIAEAASMYHRSMNSEIVARLQQAYTGLPDMHLEKAQEPPMHEQIEAMFRRSLSDDEERLVRSFRRLNADKQQALLTLLS